MAQQLGPQSLGASVFARGGLVDVDHTSNADSLLPAYEPYNQAPQTPVVAPGLVGRYRGSGDAAVARLDSSSVPPSAHRPPLGLGAGSKAASDYASRRYDDLEPLPGPLASEAELLQQMPWMSWLNRDVLD